MAHYRRPDEPAAAWEESAGWVVAGDEPAAGPGRYPPAPRRPADDLDRRSPPELYLPPGPSPEPGRERYREPYGEPYPEPYRGAYQEAYPGPVEEPYQRAYPGDYPGDYREPEPYRPPAVPSGAEYPDGSYHGYEDRPAYPAYPTYPAEPAYHPEPAHHREPAAGPPPRHPPPAPTAAEDLPPPVLPVLSWTAGLFLLPLLLVLGRLFALSDTPADSCLVPASGGSCPSPRAEAAADLVAALPGVLAALALAAALAVGLRLMARNWRPLTIGFSAAVIGAGVATLVAPIFTG